MTRSRLLLRWIPATATSIFFGALAAQLFVQTASEALRAFIPQHRTHSLLIAMSAIGWTLCGTLVGAAQSWAAKHPHPLRAEWILVTAFAFASGNFVATIWSAFQTTWGQSIAWGLMIGVAQASLLVRPQRMIAWTLATFAGFAVDIATAEAGTKLREHVLAAGLQRYYLVAAYAPVLVTVLVVGTFTGVCALLIREDFAARAGTTLRRRVIILVALIAIALVLFSIIQKLIKLNAQL